MRSACSRLVIGLAAAVLMTSCDQGEARETPASDPSTLQTLNEQWSAAAARNDLPGVMAYFADDALLLAPNVPVITGTKAIHDTWAAMLMPGNKISWKTSKAEAAQSGELAYLYGTYDVTAADPKGGPAAHDKGKLVEIWKKQADGTWKCVVDMYNSDLPAGSAP